MQRDYILRLIEEAGAILRSTLAKIIDRRTKRRDILSELKRAVQLGNLDLDLLRILDASTVIVMVTQGWSDPARIWLAAEALYLDGLASEMEDGPGAGRSSLGKALLLFRMVAPGAGVPAGFPEAAERAREIEGLLERGEEPAAS